MITGPMSAKDRYYDDLRVREEEAKAREYMHHGGVTVEPFHKPMTAALPCGNGLEWVQARTTFVVIPSWGPCPIMLGVHRGRVYKQWHCFDWHTGLRISCGKTQTDAVQNAIVLLLRKGKPAYEAAVNAELAKNDGKNLN